MSVVGLDLRRLGLAAAAIIAGYALFVGAIMAGWIVDTGADRFSPPPAAFRPLLLVGLFLLPAFVAVIGAVRRSRPLLIAAGVLALGQSVIAFSGITIPFLVPAILLLALGVDGPGSAGPRRTVIGAVAVVALGIGAWIVPFALSETSCWIARSGPGGNVVYSQVPASDTSTLGPGDLAAGCDGGSFTVQGIGLAAVLGIGSAAMAVLASARPAVAIQP